MTQFQDFEQEYGPPEHCIPVGDDAVQSYEGTLPTELLAKWRESGWCSYKKGLLWLVDPRQFSGAIDDWVHVDNGKPLVFLRTAFAHLYFWHENAAHSLDVQRGGVSRVTTRIDRLFTLLCDPEIQEKILRASLFARALPLLGSPSRDECYAFEPAIALGGSGELETIRRVKIREALGVLAQLVG